MTSHGVPRAARGLADRSDQAKAKEKQQIEEYQALEKDVLHRVRVKDYSNPTLQATSALLQQNPEYYTIWNHRRLILLDVINKELTSGNDLVANGTSPLHDDMDVRNAEKAGLTLAQQEILLLIKEDLGFLFPLLKQFPKCYWIWNHRSWLLTTATSSLPLVHAAKLWQNELLLVGKMLAMDSRNFHGWGYRRQTIHQIEALEGRSMVEDEFEYTSKMIRTNLSNFSAWHARSQMIQQLLKERHADTTQRKSFLDDELKLITKALYTAWDDQSVWFYHQFLMSTLDPCNVKAESILEPCTLADRIAYLEQEISSVQDMLDGAEDCKYIYQALLQYCLQYLELGIPNDFVSAKQISAWLAELRKLDTLRTGRWRDLEITLAKLNIT